MKKLQGILMFFVIAFLLLGCGLSNNEKEQIEKDKKEATRIALQYIKQKYGVLASVKNTYGTQHTFALETSYDGNIVVEMKDQKKIFYVWVDNENVCKDNYQYDEIKKDLRAYIKDVAGGEVPYISLTTLKTQNTAVIEDDINDIFQNEPFFEKKYQKDELFTFIRKGFLYACTIGSDLKAFDDAYVVQSSSIANEAIEEGTKKEKNDMSFIVLDFKNKESFQMVQQTIKESKNDAPEYGVLLDERIYHGANQGEDDVSYVKYHHQTYNELQIAHPISETVMVEEVDPSLIYDKLKEADEKDEEAMHLKKEKIKQVYRIHSEHDVFISFAVQKNGDTSRGIGGYVLLEDPDRGDIPLFVYEIDDGFHIAMKKKKFTDYFFMNKVGSDEIPGSDYYVILQ